KKRKLNSITNHHPSKKSVQRHHHFTHK
ncbi:hypothetical protein CCACVL1_02138, partial [Corchorus capsularis]